ncbi:MAG TPA: M20/M25/M40 family metallo-hydrolase [Terriglobia bacterium]|nr:M20/M25/M40 family metallo-hydrolase [Terriglobia bacterium]
MRWAIKSVFIPAALFVFAACVFAAPPAELSANAASRLDWTKYQNATVRLMQDYLRIDTSNPPGNELAAAVFFHRLFDANGIPNTIFPLAPKRADIYAILKGDGSLPPIILLNHLDVVRAVSRDWRVPPFSGEILHGALYGRGALDMKDIGLLQAMVMVMAANEHLHLKRDLIFLGTADEEVRDLGATWFLAHHADLLRHAAYLLTEGGTAVAYPGQGPIYGIDVAEKAPFWIRATAHGRGGHGSIPIPRSAPNRLVEAMRRVVRWQPPIRLLPLVEQYFRQIAPLQKEPLKEAFLNVRQSLEAPGFRDTLSGDPDFNYLLRDTVSLTVLHAGGQTNVIPHSAYAELDVRLLPGDDPQDFLAQLRKVIADPGIKLEPIGPFRKPNSSPTATMLYRVIEAVVRRHNPQAVVTPELNSGYTESQMFRPLGITAYGFNPVCVSPEMEQTQHARNERVPVEPLRQGLQVLFEVVTKAANQ